MAISKVDRDKLLNEYRNDINLMLQALGCNRRTVAALMSKYEDDILRWFGATNKAPIVTAAWAARLMLREELENHPQAKAFYDINHSDLI